MTGLTSWSSLLLRDPSLNPLHRRDFPPRVHTVFLVFQCGQVSFVLQSAQTHTHTHTSSFSPSLSQLHSPLLRLPPQRSVCTVRSNHGVGVGDLAASGLKRTLPQVKWLSLGGVSEHRFTTDLTLALTLAPLGCLGGGCSSGAQPGGGR